jgi:hypothetical protein
MTVIDELVISLSLNANNFNAQQQQAINTLKKFEQQATTTATNTERGAQKMVDGFSRVTKEVLGVGAAILGVNGLKDLAVNLTQVAAAGERMSEAFELDPEMLNKWQGFLQVVGNQDFGTTTASLTALAGAIQQYRATLKGPFADPETLGALNRLGITTGDLTAPGKVSDIMNRMLLTIGQNINRPENTDLKAFLLNHVPGMTPTMMRGIERSPSQATLDKYLTATAAQMQSASRMMEEIAELALALRKKLNTLLPDAEGAVSTFTGIATGKIPIVPPGANPSRNPFTILWEQLSPIPGVGSAESALRDWWESGKATHPSTSVLGRQRGGFGNIPLPLENPLHPRSSNGGIAVPLDTSTMPRTDRFPDGRRSGGNVTNNNITANISAPKSDNPKLWADIWADRVIAVMAQGGSQ